MKHSIIVTHITWVEHIEGLLSSKDMLIARGSLPGGSYSSDNSTSAFPFHLQCQQVPNLHGATLNEAEMLCVRLDLDPDMHPDNYGNGDDLPSKLIILVDGIYK